MGINRNKRGHGKPRLGGMMDKIKKVIIKEGPFKLDELKPGEIQQWGVRYYLACPRCGMGVALEHTVNIEEDNSVTINPSVGHQACGLHIFVKHGKIEYLTDIQK